MLQRLIIRNFVIVDQLELEFRPGFGALTGETGAGKSILIDALSLALGERAEASVIRTGAERAEIAAEFDVATGGALASWLQANDFEMSTCLLRRIIDQTGRSRAYINGTAATLAQLRELATFLADIHGQNAHHSLLNAESQRALLDAYAGAQNLVREVATAYAAWRQAREARKIAMTNSEAAARERELLEWQVKELTALAFNIEAWQETETEQRRLSSASELLDAATAALVLLDNSETAALSALQHAGVRLNELTAVDPALNEAAKLFDSAVIQLEESALALRRYRDHLELDPARLKELDARIDTVTQMARKYRVPPTELPVLLTRLTVQLDELSLLADSAALNERVQATEAAYLAVAKKLSALRSKAARQLSQAVSSSMQELAMDGSQFAIALEPLSEGASFGLENVEFQVAANAGQSLRPLAKVASGGEISRIGLALQVIASQANPVGTLIFDEVDVGIGGRVAEIVGRMLRSLGKSHQVLCVTHLPQVAAQADWQWSIIKETQNGAVVSSVQILDQASRVAEIARMLGGEKITSTTRRHAAEMLGLIE
jgi:DNA repair protein RecN (Recombination protein N)